MLLSLLLLLLLLTLGKFQHQPSLLGLSEKPRWMGPSVLLQRKKTPLSPASSSASFASGVHRCVLVLWEGPRACKYRRACAVLLLLSRLPDRTSTRSHQAFIFLLFAYVHGGGNITTSVNSFCPKQSRRLFAFAITAVDTLLFFPVPARARHMTQQNDLIHMEEERKARRPSLKSAKKTST